MPVCRIKVATALFALSALLSASNASIAADPPPRPEKYFVPVLGAAKLHRSCAILQGRAIKVGPYNIWSINTPNGGIGNVIVLEGDNGVILIDTSVGVEHAERARELMLTLTKKPVVPSSTRTITPTIPPAPPHLSAERTRRAAR